jgi:hypothetical protein
MNRRKCSVVIAFKASRVRSFKEQRTFQSRETLWWDTEQTSDPVVFEFDNNPFTTDRTEFLKSVYVPED